MHLIFTKWNAPHVLAREISKVPIKLLLGFVLALLDLLLLANPGVSSRFFLSLLEDLCHCGPLQFQATYTRPPRGYFCLLTEAPLGLLPVFLCSNHSDFVGALWLRWSQGIDFWCHAVLVFGGYLGLLVCRILCKLDCCDERQRFAVLKLLVFFCFLYRLFSFLWVDPSWSLKLIAACGGVNSIAVLLVACSGDFCGAFLSRHDAILGFCRRFLSFQAPPLVVSFLLIVSWHFYGCRVWL